MASLLTSDFLGALAQCWAQISHLLLVAEFFLLLFVLTAAKDCVCLLIHLFLYPLPLYGSTWLSLHKFLSLSFMLVSAQMPRFPPAFLSYLSYHQGQDIPLPLVPLHCLSAHHRLDTISLTNPELWAMFFSFQAANIMERSKKRRTRHFCFCPGI